MSLIPSMFGGRRSNIFDPFSLDIGRRLQRLTSSKPTFLGSVKVEVEEGRVLQISGERSREKEEDKNDKWHRIERSRGKFLRRFRLPENAKVDQVKACMVNGVLTLTVPKEEVKSLRSRQLKSPVDIIKYLN